MFNRGIETLLQSLPTISGLTLADIRRMLTRAWLEATDTRLGADTEATAGLAGDLRRLATALEVHAILRLETDAAVRACAFVAAESLMIAHELAPSAERETRYGLFGTVRRFEQVEAGLLYLIAGYDANAALTAADLGDPPGVDPEEPVAEWALGMIVGLLRLVPVDRTSPPPEPGPDALLRSTVRHELWRRTGTHVADHVDWLTYRADVDPAAGDALRTLAEQLEHRTDDTRSAATHPDLHHLLLLLAAACNGTSARSLRWVPPPPDDAAGRFVAYQSGRAPARPLLWPAAEEYARTALPGPHAHAVVAVPTGSGKSSVAELAVAQALHRGWVLYLAPTNALVGQIRRHAAEVFGADTVREFIGGAEYTQLAGESLAAIDDRQVLVMTPEKCSLALRQNPEAFARLALCVLDEAHLLGERNGRGVIAELVLAEIMHRAPRARLLLMSALVANPHNLREWLQSATQAPAVVIDEPWRPTRTLRAIAGIDHARGNAAANAAYRRLSTMGPHRVNQKFETPVALLAGLQGAWTSTETSDYQLIPTDIQVPSSVNRQQRVSFDGYCTPATWAIVQRLGERGDKVLAFLPRSRHDSFLAANSMPGFGEIPLGEDVEALLLLADLELGVESALRPILSKRVAVHTSALLREEQRASEIAFDREIAVAMFATGTMAQGLNLPATAVVVGGTDIGYDQADPQQRRDRTRTQLLNAIGRAGRAHVAPRSLAVVVPNKAVILSSAADAARAVQRAEFLRDEDASAALASTLDGLVRDALSGALGIETMTNAEQTAFAFLSFASDQGDGPGVIGKTWAAHRAQAQPSAAAIAGAITAAGSDLLHQAGAPSWVALAAHQSGIPLPETVRLYDGLRTHLASQDVSDTIPQWAALLVDLLKPLTVSQLQRILPEDPYGTSRLAGIYQPDQRSRDDAWVAYLEALQGWMSGQPLIAVARSVHPRPIDGNHKRGPRDPIPRVIAIVGDGYRFGLALVAGCLGAITAVGREHEPDGPWDLPADSARSLNLLPLAVRSGADSPDVIAWMRAGVHTRAAAHLLSTIFPAPPGLSDDELQRWAFGRLMELSEGAIVGITDDAQDKIIRAIRIARDTR